MTSNRLEHVHHGDVAVLEPAGQDRAPIHEAVSRIKDSAARKLATWFEYRNGDFDASAEAIESFRLANPEWPGQEELRERAEIALFLADASPEKVRAFFGNSTPLTGAGKAALAGAFMSRIRSPAIKAISGLTTCTSRLIDSPHCELSKAFARFASSGGRQHSWLSLPETRARTRHCPRLKS